MKLGDNPDLKTFVTKEIWAAAEDELVIIIGHNEISYGGRNLRFDKDISKCTTDLGLPSS